MTQRASRKYFQRGFTIVELLIVVVVIAILAAITIVAYNGIQNRAKESSVKSTLSSLNKKLELYRIDASAGGESYPSNLSSLGSPGGGNATVNYQTVPGGKFYCIDTAIDSVRYFHTSIDATPRQGSCPTTAGLIDWWPLNGNVVNLATNETNATAYGTIATTGQNGKSDGAYQFNGVDAYIDTGDTTARSNFTAAVWVYPTANGSYRTPLSETRDCCGSGYRGLEIKSSYSNTPSASVSLWAGGTGSAIGAGGANVNLNQWNLLVGTYDGSVLRMYHNGDISGSSNYTGVIGTPTASLKIGRTGVQTAGFFVGSIDDVRIYDRALSAAEIRTLYESGAF